MFKGKGTFELSRMEFDTHSAAMVWTTGHLRYIEHLVNVETVGDRIVVWYWKEDE